MELPGGQEQPVADRDSGAGEYTIACNTPVHPACVHENVRVEIETPLSPHHELDSERSRAAEKILRSGVDARGAATTLLPFRIPRARHMAEKEISRATL